ncbi:SCO family protein [Robiginitalea sp. M366]|uniref:SCO family protein n=1 Tax=Robiginitalea aestuariiviva TaxID=3036903 RepID=UPI00240E11F8|nr:SCO family protein [Robiginitalea aestuariiviva]MDG1571000.1 SCO family protein [Robiginitalea aestuariiviva]
MAKQGKYHYIWIGAVILVFGIIFVPEILERFQAGAVVQHDRISTEAGPLEYITLNGERRKAPSFALLNQDSLLITDADYRGKVYVAEFFFTTCPTICPVMTQNLLDLQETFADKEDFGVASFTINPRYDTPGVLKAYAERYGITDMDWHLLTGERDSIYELANAGYNIFAAEMPDVPGGFEHSGLFALIDKNGYIRSRKDEYGNPIVYYRGTITQAQGANAAGETEQISLLKADIEKLLEEPYEP